MTNVFPPDLSLEEIDRRTVMHPFTNLKAHRSGTTGGPRIIDTGSGIRIRDHNGKELIDGFAGLYCVNVGYGRTEIADAVYEQTKKLAYYHTYVGHSNEPVIRLSERIAEKAPDGMTKIYYGMSGSDANETQAKLIWYYNNVLGRSHKKKLIARHRAYHGCSVVSGSLTGLSFYHQAFDLPVERILHTVTPHHYWNAEPGMSEREFSQYCADQLETLIIQTNPETVAALFAEPVLGTGGIIPPPEGYWEAMQKVLEKYDVLLVADEVVTGFGRIGSYFGSPYYGMKPDLITVAKGMTSGYFPLSGVIIGEKVWNVLEKASDMLGAMSHGYTYSGHAAGAAAALANLDIIDREKLVDNARDTGAYFQKRMHETFGDHPIVGEVRGVGLLAALEFVADKRKKKRFDPNLKVGARMSAGALENGLIARALPHGDILGFAPPLIITREEVDDIIDRTRRAVDKVTDGLVKEGAWQG